MAAGTEDALDQKGLVALGERVQVVGEVQALKTTYEEQVLKDTVLNNMNGPDSRYSLATKERSFFKVQVQY